MCSLVRPTERGNVDHPRVGCAQLVAIEHLGDIDELDSRMPLACGDDRAIDFRDEFHARLLFFAAKPTTPVRDSPGEWCDSRVPHVHNAGIWERALDRGIDAEVEILPESPMRSITVLSGSMSNAESRRLSPFAHPEKLRNAGAAGKGLRAVRLGPPRYICAPTL